MRVGGCKALRVAARKCGIAQALTRHCHLMRVADEGAGKVNNLTWVAVSAAASRGR